MVKNIIPNYHSVKLNFAYIDEEVKFFKSLGIKNICKTIAPILSSGEELLKYLYGDAIKEK